VANRNVIKDPFRSVLSVHHNTELEKKYTLPFSIPLYITKCHRCNQTKGGKSVMD